MQTSNILDIAVKAMGKDYVCNKCLGRLFAKLIHGMTNEERGKIVRGTISLIIEAGKEFEAHASNFQEYSLRKMSLPVYKHGPCAICNDIFNSLIPCMTTETIVKASNYEFESFLIGIKLNQQLYEMDTLLQQMSPEYSESIKNEINRMVGSKVEQTLGKTVDHQNPQLIITIDLKNNEVYTKAKNLLVHGGYMKLARGIPQTVWHCKICKGKGCRQCNWSGRMYRASVQQIIEKPFLKATKSKKSSFHGAGREDVDVRCLDYRQFILEVENPMRRKIDLSKIKDKINESKYVQVGGLRFASKEDVVQVKNALYDKVYHAIVVFEKEIDEGKLNGLFSLKDSEISQKTPIRVLHRRADMIRKKRIIDLKFSKFNKKKLDLVVECAAGAYVKEFINGDNQRTKPSIAEILDNRVNKIVLDVIKIKDR